MANFDDMKAKAKDLKDSAEDKYQDMKHTGGKRTDDTGQEDTTMMDDQGISTKTGM